MIISAMARPRCSPPSMCSTAGLAAAACSATGIGVHPLQQPDRSRDPAGKLRPRHSAQLRQHKHPKVQAWLDRHPGFIFYYRPKSASWVNAVEGFFANLSQRRLKRGCSDRSSISRPPSNGFLAETNVNPKPFTWTADPDHIIAAVNRGYQALDSLH